MEQRIETIISAVDDYSANINRFKTAMGEVGGAVSATSATTMSWTEFLKGRMGPAMREFGNHTDAVRALSVEYKQYKATGVAAHQAVDAALASTGQASNKLTRQIDGLTSGLDWAAGGVKRFKNLLEGIAFGGALGLVAGGVSAFTEMLIEAYKSSGMTADKISALNGELIQQATNWKMITPAVGGATEAMINYYNARLKLAQFEGVQRIAEIQAEIKKQETLQKNYEINAKAFPQRTELTRKANDYAVSIEGLKLELASLNTVAALTPTTLKRVQDAVDQASIKPPDLVDRGYSEGALSARILGELQSPPLGEKLNLAARTVNQTFAEKMIAGAKDFAGDEYARDLVWAMKAGVETVLKEDGLNFRMAAFPTIDANDNTAYFAMLDERYQRETEYEEMLLNSNLAYSDQRIAIERNLQNTILSLKFGAANQGIALLSLVGQKSKALMLAALVAQKALAIAQVWIQTQVASSAALAPPPLGLGPVFGAPLAASVQLWGKIQMGLIAATGLAEAAMGGGGSPASMSGVGGGGGVGALPITAPTRTEQQAPISVTLIVNTLDGKDVNWARVMEDNILPTMEKISGDGNRPINIRVAQA